jgi:hypothetical protein
MMVKVLWPHKRCLTVPYRMLHHRFRTDGVCGRWGRCPAKYHGYQHKYVRFELYDSHVVVQAFDFLGGQLWTYWPSRYEPLVRRTYRTSHVGHNAHSPPLVPPVPPSWPITSIPGAPRGGAALTLAWRTSTRQISDGPSSVRQTSGRQTSARHRC